MIEGLVEQFATLEDNAALRTISAAHGVTRLMHFPWSLETTSVSPAG